MSYDLDSAIFKIVFTDGSYLSVINTGMYRPKYERPGQYEMIVPNLFISDLENNYTVVKYDKDGNLWKINNDQIQVNNHVYSRSGKLMCLGYNPDTGELTNYNISGITIPSMTNYHNGPYPTYAVSGITYLRDTNGTDYSSFGAALYAAEDAYANSPIMGSPAWYHISNITKKSNNVSMHGYNAWYGETLNLADTDFWWFIPGNRGTGTNYTTSLTESLENFDPEPKPIDSTDPFEPGGDSSGNNPGGTGNFDGTGDDIDIPTPPTLSASDTGFITLFNPSLAQLKSLASYMWTGLFDINTFRKIFADPMDCILGLSIVPVAVPNGASKEVTVGNIGTGITMTTAASQYVQVDCGSINVNEYWGAYLDYDPYTKAEIYLPYIGTHPIATDDIMGKTVSVKYNVDILSGACTAFVKCGGSVLYEFIGQCSSSIPISANDWTNVINGVINIAGSIGTMVATGGLSAPIQAGAAEAGAISAKAVVSGGQQIASTAINSMKPTVEKSGAMGGTGGMLAVQTPYLILTRPRQALPRSQNSFTGYPAFKTCYLNELSGYTEVEKIHLENVPGTDDEIVEIANLLARGVIL